MRFQSPRGTRDFYPPEMTVRNWIADRWRSVSVRNGFDEVDGPIFEPLDLYRLKSGDTIVSELFHFADRGGREFAIRPEMTPTLARMVAAKAASLPHPIKWFCMPRICRAERPQRGRLREFFQWNIDIFGEEGVVADAECIFVAADFFREAGLSSEHFVIKINSRKLVSSLLEHAGIAPDRHETLYGLLDKRDKVQPIDFEKMVAELGLNAAQRDTLASLGQAEGPGGLESVRTLLAGHDDGTREVARMEELFGLLAAMGVADCCRFDMGVVRGLAYYTGIVFEAFGRGGLQRAICGGGRYDQLIKSVGGPPMPATGFATSDVVIQDLLKELDLLPGPSGDDEIFVIDATPEFFPDVLAITARLRAGGHRATFSYKRQSVSKQFKQAAGKTAHRVVVVGAETRERNVVQLKDMSTGVQQPISVEALLASPFRPVRS